MMSKAQMIVLVSAACAMPLVACAAGDPVLVNDEMTATVIPQSQAIWEVTNAAMDDDGNPVAAKVQPADWVKLEQAALAIQASFERLHGASSIRVAKPGVKISGDDSPDGAGTLKVQGFVDANPDGFRSMSQSFSNFAGGMAKAAKERDLKVLMNNVDEMDGKCESCHKVYWFPNQPPPT